MGTGFGKEASHHVHNITFDRDELSKQVFSMEYASRANLIERGIVDTVSPNPFPGDEGCKPPKNWRG